MKTKPLMALLASVMLLGACKGSNSSKYEAINNNADSMAVTADTNTTTKLVKTADMRFKVKSVQQTGDAIAALTAKSGGMVLAHHMAANILNTQDIRISNDSVKRVSAFTSNADMTIKVPSGKLEVVMNEIAHMGVYIDVQKMDIEDRTLNQLAAKLKMQNRKELVSKQTQSNGSIVNSESIKQLKDDMVDQKINDMQTNAAVKYSTVTLNFYQSSGVNQEIVANDDPSAYQLPFFKRLVIALNSGWFTFTGIILGIVDLWVFIAITAVLWLLYRYYKRKHPALFISKIKS